MFYPKKIIEKDPIELHKGLLDHIRPANITMIERSKFHKIVCNSNETFKEFSLRVQQQGAKCEFQNTLNDQLRDRLVAGINDIEVEKKLLQELNLSYVKAKEIVFDCDKVNSAISAPMQVLQLDDSPQQQVNFTKPHHQTSQRFYNGKRNSNFKQYTPLSSSKQPSGKCYSCGGNHFRPQCKFRNSKCNTCGKQGHISKVCRSNSNRNVAISLCFVKKFCHCD